jgi:hypothetical protein
MRCFSSWLLASALLGGISAARAQDQNLGSPRPLVQSPLADGITLTATGQAKDFDRFFLVLSPIPKDVLPTVGGAGSFGGGQDYAPAQKAIRAAMNRYGLKEATAPYIYVGGYRTNPSNIAFLLPSKKFDGKSLGSGTIAEVMAAAIEAGAHPSGSLVSSYSAERRAEARRDALADAMRVGRLEATEIAQATKQKAGKVLAVRVDTIEGMFSPSATQNIGADGVAANTMGSNFISLTLRFAIE